MQIRQFFAGIASALKDNDTDYTEVRMRKAIWMLSIPMVLEVIMESVFAVVDIFFVSKLGADAVATVGITESLLTVIYAIALGLGMGTTALISRRIGEKQAGKARSVAFQSILTGMAVSILIAFPGWFWAKDILRLMGGNQVMVEQMSGYTSLLLGTNMVVMLLFIINAVFRSAGDASMAMRVLWVANITNLVLDPLLIFGIGPFPELGIKGAAIATTIGRGLGVCYQLYLLFFGKGRIQIRPADMTPDFRVIGQLIKLSLGGIGQNIIATSSWIALMRIVSIFGSNVLAGYTIAIRIVVFVLFPSWGISNAAATLVGQNLGANKPDRAEKAVWVAGRVNMIALGLISLLFILIPGSFIRIFTLDPAIIPYGIQALRTISYGFVFYGLGMVLMNAINGAGDTITPTKLNFLCFWLIEIPLAWFLALYLDWQETGVFYAIVIAESILCLISLWWFRLGKWKLKVV